MPAIAPAQNFIDTITSPTTRVTRRVAIYEQDGKTLWTGIDPTISRLLEGSVSVDGTRDERRDLDLTLENTDRLLTPKVGGLWYDKVIVPYRGVIDNTTGATWEVPLGRFLIDNINDQNFPHEVKLSCRDFTKKMLLSLFTVTETFIAGTDVSQLIGALGANAGVTKFSLPHDGTTLTADYTFDQGTSRWEAAKQIANDYDYDLYFDVYGTLVLSKKVDPTLGAITWVFKTGSPDGNLVTVGRQLDDSNLFNHVLVIGGSSDSAVPPVSAEVVNNEPTSPTNITELGDRVFTYTSSNLTTVAQCLALAKSLIKVQALESYSLTIESLVFPWLEANTVVQIFDPDAEAVDPVNYLMDTFTVPLGLGTMSATAKRITIVGSDIL